MRVLELKVSFSQETKPKLYNEIVYREVKDTSNTVLNYERIEYNGISFKSPFISLKGATHNAGFDYYQFSDNAYIVVMEKQGASLIRALFDQFIPGYKFKVIEILGQETVNSDFKLTKSVIGSSPAELSFFAGQEELEYKRGMIMLADYYLPNEANDAIYEFQLGEVSGIQYGNPGNSKNSRVILEIFKNERHRYTIMMYDETLSQDEIDFLLNSLVFK
ncbi:MAG TPA: hypothetical protein GXX49_06760 [Clostridiaceae bacterium]|nr:hypothetical protein [Clostridiaceae bacterium]